MDESKDEKKRGARRKSRRRRETSGTRAFRQRSRTSTKQRQRQEPGAREKGQPHQGRVGTAQEREKAAFRRTIQTGAGAKTKLSDKNSRSFNRSWGLRHNNRLLTKKSNQFPNDGPQNSFLETFDFGVFSRCIVIVPFFHQFKVREVSTCFVRSRLLRDVSVG